jgi:hypothetical protein
MSEIFQLPVNAETAEVGPGTQVSDFAIIRSFKFVLNFGRQIFGKKEYRIF